MNRASSQILDAQHPSDHQPGPGGPAPGDRLLGQSHQGEMIEEDRAKKLAADDKTDERGRAESRR